MPACHVGGPGSSPGTPAGRGHRPTIGTRVRIGRRRLKVFESTPLRSYQFRRLKETGTWDIAQLVERRPVKAMVVGSSPTIPANSGVAQSVRADGLKSLVKSVVRVHPSLQTK